VQGARRRLDAELLAAIDDAFARTPRPPGVRSSARSALMRAPVAAHAEPVEAIALTGSPPRRSEVVRVWGR
jgi:hypothetical protein